MSLIPLPVAIPLLVAAVIAAAEPIMPRRLLDTVAILAAGAVAVICGLLLMRSGNGPLVYWFGGWTPRHGAALGISFFVDQIGAGLACMSAVLTTAALVFSWRYFDAVGAVFHSLMLVFLAAMAGFSLTGDLFNMFVFFELMGVAAYALTGYKIEEESALEGAINFAITNSIGAFVILLGIALLYGRTGALNLAQIGRELAARPADSLSIVAMALITCGFLVKAAMAPFHFWLSEAHAVAPTPVCVLFSGVMTELGLYAAIRVYWTIFAGVSGLETAGMRDLLMGMGSLTAIVGAIMCFQQRHLKRLLAFSTISHIGMLMIGAGLLLPVGLAGASIYVMGHGLVKGALFICAGIILNHADSVDEVQLHARPLGFGLTAAIYTAAAFGLAGLPPFATALGKSLIERSADSIDARWAGPVLILCSALTAGAVMRAGGRIFLGWGVIGEEEKTPSTERDEPESHSGHATPYVMLAPAAIMTALALLVGLAPRLGHGVAVACARFQDSAAYVTATFNSGTPTPTPAILSGTGEGWASGFISAGAAVAAAALGLFAERLPRFVTAPAQAAGAAIRAAHTQRIGDYVTWLLIGIAAFEILLTIGSR